MASGTVLIRSNALILQHHIRTGICPWHEYLLVLIPNARDRTTDTVLLYSIAAVCEKFNVQSKSVGNYPEGSATLKKIHDCGRCRDFREAAASGLFFPVKNESLDSYEVCSKKNENFQIKRARRVRLSIFFFFYHFGINAPEV